MFGRQRRERRIAAVQKVQTALNTAAEAVTRAQKAVEAAEGEFPGIVGYDLWDGVRDSAYVVAVMAVDEAPALVRRERGADAEVTP